MKKFLIYGLVVVVGLGAVLGLILYVPDILDGKKVDSALSRMQTGSLLLRTATEIESKQRKWPKNLAELKSANPTPFNAEDAPSLEGVEYNLLEDKGETAVYEFVYNGSSRKVTVTSTFGKARGPEAANMSTGSQ